MSRTRRTTRPPSERTLAREDTGNFDTAISLDATRVAQDPTSIAHRAATARTARGNLAAMVCDRWGIDPTREDNHWHRLGAAARDFAELCDALGLTGIEVAPGTCAGCGQPLPLRSQVKSRTGEHQDLCTPCQRGAKLTPAPVTEEA